MGDAGWEMGLGRYALSAEGAIGEMAMHEKKHEPSETRLSLARSRQIRVDGKHPQGYCRERNLLRRKLVLCTGAILYDAGKNSH